MKRRDFIQKSAVSALMPSFLGKNNDLGAMDSPWMRMLTNAAAETNHVLVIIRMSGGNDGLNTVIPLDQYPNLSSARANILINESQVAKLNGTTTTALHPALKDVANLYNEGKVKIIQAAGYPNQNFSHFRSTDIWMSASGSTENIYTGWVACPGCPNAHSTRPSRSSLNSLSRNSIPNMLLRLSRLSFSIWRTCTLRWSPVIIMCASHVSPVQPLLSPSHNACCPFALSRFLCLSCPLS